MQFRHVDDISAAAKPTKHEAFSSFPTGRTSLGLVLHMCCGRKHFNGTKYANDICRRARITETTQRRTMVFFTVQKDKQFMSVTVDADQGRPCRFSTGTESSCIQTGATPWIHFHTKTAVLITILRGTGSQ